MYNSFELFFSGASAARWWRLECKRLFCLWVDRLIAFFEERKKAMCQLSVDCKKCDRKKQQQGGLCGSRQKDRASPEVRGAGIFDGWGLLCGAARNYLKSKIPQFA
jgi:hypothetical protein